MMLDSGHVITVFNLDPQIPYYCYSLFGEHRHLEIYKTSKVDSVKMFKWEEYYIKTRLDITQLKNSTHIDAGRTLLVI